jgi:Uncharacterised protein family (UPF0158)
MLKQGHPPLRKLKVDLAALEEAFDNTSSELHYYLDLQTGEVVLVADEIRRELEGIYEELNDAGDQEFKHLAAMLNQSRLPDWQKEAVLEAHRVEEGFGERYRELPLVETHDAYEDMEDFIETLKDESLQERLWQAIRGRGAFRYFKDVLADYPQARERWFKFKDECVHQRVLEWLADEGIEPVA